MCSKTIAIAVIRTLNAHSRSQRCSVVRVLPINGTYNRSRSAKWYPGNRVRWLQNTIVGTMQVCTSLCGKTTKRSGRTVNAKLNRFAGVARENVCLQLLARVVCGRNLNTLLEMLCLKRFPMYLGTH